MAAFGQSHRPRLGSFWWPPTPPVLAANREAAKRRARLPVWRVCGTQSRRRDHVTASPQVRDTSVSGGQGTDNAQADGPIPSSPTKDLIKGHFSNREHKHLNAELDRLAEDDKFPSQSVSGPSGRRSSTGVVPTTCPRAIVGGTDELPRLVAPLGVVRSPPSANSYLSQCSGGHAGP